jgi:hypothetical protein
LRWFAVDGNRVVAVILDASLPAAQEWCARRYGSCVTLTTPRFASEGQRAQAARLPVTLIPGERPLAMSAAAGGGHA